MTTAAGHRINHFSVAAIKQPAEEGADLGLAVPEGWELITAGVVAAGGRMKKRRPYVSIMSTKQGDWTKSGTDL